MSPPNDRKEKPSLFVIKAQDLSLSGPSLLEIMRAVLSKGRPFRFCARGWSMAPFILDGDVITVAPLRQPLPKIGDVVAFVRPEEGKLVVHRVVNRLSCAVVIQGDNTLDLPQEVIPQENLLGMVTQIERNDRITWLGLGLERYAIAWLSRNRLLNPLIIRLASWAYPRSRR